MRTIVRSCSPLTFFYTGFSWLMLASILGLTILIGLVRGTPLPPWIRTLHVHAVLIGGVAQIILGGFLLLISPLHSVDRKESDTHPIPFWGINGGLVGMLVGFWLHQPIIVAVTGFVVIAACCVVIYTVWSRASRMGKASLKQAWYYGVAFLGLVAGSVCGELLALGLMPDSYGYVRLAHIHLVVLGFMVLAIVGLMHHLLPLVWNAPLWSPRMMQTATIFIPLGIGGLIGGFLHSSVPIELAAGAMFLVGALLFAGNLVRTWFSSADTGSAASDHLLISTFFFVFTIILGIFLGANNLSDSHVLPYGTLHLITYTHMTFIGFMMNAMMGAFSYLLPVTLAANRVANPKKRGPYFEQLTTIMNRWRALQLTTLSLGTMGLGILAALTWNVPLTSVYVLIATWACFGLLLISFVLFSVKLTAVLVKQPEDSAMSHTPPNELRLSA